MGKIKPINIKLDDETKEQFKTLAFIKDMNLQEIFLHFGFLREL